MQLNLRSRISRHPRRSAATARSQLISLSSRDSTARRSYRARDIGTDSAIERSNERGPFARSGSLSALARLASRRTFTSRRNNSVSLRSPLSCCSGVGVSFRTKSRRPLCTWLIHTGCCLRQQRLRARV